MTRIVLTPLSIAGTPNEDPWIREHFEGELDKRNMVSAIPAEAYQDPDYEWSYSDGE